MKTNNLMTVTIVLVSLQVFLRMCIGESVISFGLNRESGVRTVILRQESNKNRLFPFVAENLKVLSDVKRQRQFTFLHAASLNSD